MEFRSNEFQQSSAITLLTTGSTPMHLPHIVNYLVRRNIYSITLILLTLVTLIAAIIFTFRFELTYWWHRDTIDRSAERYHVHPHLLASVIWQETHFNPAQKGKAGEIGLMQIMPGSAMEWAKAENIKHFQLSTLVNPTTTTMAGAWYLGRALSRWKNKNNAIPYALAEYNAGASNALRWDRYAKTSNVEFLNAITYPSTRRYIIEISRRYHNFGKPWRNWDIP
jgi:soluble lytic murein transglycosylase